MSQLTPFVGGPVCGCEVRCSKSGVRVLVVDGRVRLAAVYERDGGRYRYRRTVEPEQLQPRQRDEVAVFAATAAVYDNDGWDGRPVRVWSLRHHRG